MKTLQQIHERADTDLPLRQYRAVLLPDPATQQTIQHTDKHITAYSDEICHYPSTPNKRG